MSCNTKDKPNVGLLPSTQVNSGAASANYRGSGMAMADYTSHSARHDQEFYDKWNRERQEAIARGEDPNAKFLALVEARRQEGYQGKIRRFVDRIKGKDPARGMARGGVLTEDEIRKAKAVDAANATESPGEVHAIDNITKIK